MPLALAQRQRRRKRTDGASRGLGACPRPCPLSHVLSRVLSDAPGLREVRLSHCTAWWCKASGGDARRHARRCDLRGGCTQHAGAQRPQRARDGDSPMAVSTSRSTVGGTRSRSEACAWGQGHATGKEHPLRSHGASATACCSLLLSFFEIYGLSERKKKYYDRIVMV